MTAAGIKCEPSSGLSLDSLAHHSREGENLDPRLRGDDENSRGDDENSRGDDENNRGDDENSRGDDEATLFRLTSNPLNPSP